MFLTRDAARLFSSKELASLSNGNFEFLLKVADFYSDNLADSFSVEDVLSCCYFDFRRNYKNEYYIKNLIAEKILIGRHSLNTATMLNEFRVGSNKADCVILNGSSVCYEIKSEFDSLARLPDQVSAYLKLFDQVYTVAPEVHISKIEGVVPDSVGILVLSKRGSLSEFRAAKQSAEVVDVDVLMSSLRKEEYLSLTSLLLGEVPRVPNGAIYGACREMLREVDSVSLRKGFCEVLKKKRKVDKDFVSRLPRSLLVAGIEYGFSAASKIGLIDALSVTFSKDALCTAQYCGENGMS